MPIRPGERIPAVTVRTMAADGVRTLETEELFAGKRALLFGVPGAFTPACSDTHLPGYLVHAARFSELGIDLVSCLSVNDAFVMDSWAREREVGDAILMLADGNGDFTRALGLELDGCGFGFGIRCRRFAAVIDAGVVSMIAVEPGRGVTVSSAEEMLAALRERSVETVG